MSSPNSQTRQQLEELDALLQRMLSLPLSHIEETPTPPPPPQVKVQVPLPPSPPVMTIREIHGKPPESDQPQIQSWRVELPPNTPTLIPSAPQMIPGWDQSTQITSVPNTVTPQNPPSTKTENPTTPQMVYGQETTPLTKETPVNEEPPPVAQVVVYTPPSRSTSVASEPPLPVILWPFYLVDRVYTVITYILGPLTSWLSGPSMKHFLGWLGIIMILLAIGLAGSLMFGFDWSTEILGQMP
jgi:hypothetical protein